MVTCARRGAAAAAWPIRAVKGKMLPANVAASRAVARERGSDMERSFLPEAPAIYWLAADGPSWVPFHVPVWDGRGACTTDTAHTLLVHRQRGMRAETSAATYRVVPERLDKGEALLGT